MDLNPSSPLRWGDYSLHLLGLLVRVLGWQEKGIHSQGLGPETKRRKFTGPRLTRAATPTSHSPPRCSCPHSVPRGLLTTSAKKKKKRGLGLRSHTGQGLTRRSSTHTVSAWVRVRGAQADWEEGAVLQPALS